MKRYILSAVALAAFTGTALAQQPPVPPSAPTPPAASVTAPNADAVKPPPPPAGVEGGPEERAGPPPRGPEGLMGPHGHRPPPPPPPPSKAAHFQVEDGDTRIDIKCADDEPMKACADILLQVIDRLNGSAHP